MINNKNNMFPKKKLILFHPECPGTKIVVYRNWVENVCRPKHFATLKECIEYSETKQN